MNYQPLGPRMHGNWSITHDKHTHAIRPKKAILGTSEIELKTATRPWSIDRNFNRPHGVSDSVRKVRQKMRAPEREGTPSLVHSLVEPRGCYSEPVAPHGDQRAALTHSAAELSRRR